MGRQGSRGEDTLLCIREQQLSRHRPLESPSVRDLPLLCLTQMRLGFAGNFGNAEPFAGNGHNAVIPSKHASHLSNSQQSSPHLGRSQQRRTAFGAVLASFAEIAPHETRFVVIAPHEGGFARIAVGEKLHASPNAKPANSKHSLSNSRLVRGTKPRQTQTQLSHPLKRLQREARNSRVIHHTSFTKRTTVPDPELRLWILTESTSNCIRRMPLPLSASFDVGGVCGSSRLKPSPQSVTSTTMRSGYALTVASIPCPQV